MELGVAWGTLRVVPHQPEWEQVFRVEKKRLEEIFGRDALAIEHVGSMAVPGLRAKPIIDVAVQVPAIGLVQPVENGLVALGYTERVNRLEGPQRVFVKSGQEAETHHLHVIQAGYPEWDRKVLFRNYLRQHAEARQAYEALKLHLWQQFGNDRRAYTDGKKSFIDAVVEQAGHGKQS